MTNLEKFNRSPPSTPGRYWIGIIHDPKNLTVLLSVWSGESWLARSGFPLFMYNPRNSQSAPIYWASLEDYPPTFVGSVQFRADLGKFIQECLTPVPPETCPEDADP